jgi:hypothetical protein
LGSEVFAAGNDESVGFVVQTEGAQALVCIQTGSAEAALTTVGGAVLTVLALPYLLKDDI